MNPTNPYNCSKPGNLFVGYDQLLIGMLAGFINGNSFAIIGGRRCGKTSLLIEVQKRLERDGLKPFRPLPLYLDIQGLGSLTPNLLFGTIYDLLTQDINVDSWSNDDLGNDYQTFLRQLDSVSLRLDKKFGGNWLAVLLIDELDSAIRSLPDDKFFVNLRNLLMMSRFRRNFRVVATGVKEMAHLVTSGSSPLNNLRNKYLGILSQDTAHQLVVSGFPKQLEADQETILFDITGQHPYLLQGVLEKLWEHRSKVDNSIVQNSARHFIVEHHDFARWIESFGEAEHAVYSELAGSENGNLTWEQLRKKIKPPLNKRIDDAVLVLSYHGIVDVTDQNKPRLTSTLFRDWYIHNYMGYKSSNSKAKNGGNKMVKPKGKTTLTKTSGKKKNKKKVQIFISYARENTRRVRKIFDKLRRRGYSLWIDQENLVGGVEWEPTIEQALDVSTLAILFLSKKYVTKTGFVQKETVKILDLVNYRPQGKVFLIPVRLESCEFPSRLKRFQMVDHYKKDGFTRLLEAIESALD